MTEDSPEARQSPPMAARVGGTGHRAVGRRWVALLLPATLLAGLSGCAAGSTATGTTPPTASAGTAATATPSLASPTPSPTPTPVSVPALDPTAVTDLELIEFYATGGDLDPADSDQHISQFFTEVEGWLAGFPSVTGSGWISQVEQDNNQLGPAVTALERADVVVAECAPSRCPDWDNPARAVSNDAGSLDSALGYLYLAPLGTPPTTIGAASGHGETNTAMLDGAAPPYGPAVRLAGGYEVWVPFTGRYTVTWSVGAECQDESWSIDDVLGSLAVRHSAGDAASGTLTVPLSVGTLVMQTDITEYVNGGPFDTVCPWQWSISGPITS